jgi:hypothetical protein
VLVQNAKLIGFRVFVELAEFSRLAAETAMSTRVLFVGRPASVSLAIRSSQLLPVLEFASVRVPFPGGGLQATPPCSGERL